MMEPTILLVDDAAEDRALTTRSIHKRRPNVQVIDVPDSVTFESKLQEGGFQAVITDYRIRWATGLEVLQRIKARYPDCPVVMFTGTGTEQIAVHGIKAGLRDYIKKSATAYDEVAEAILRVVDEPQSTPEQSRLLLVDDEMTALEGLKGLIQVRVPGVTIDVTPNPTEALEWVLTRRYDVLVTDIKMPRLDGLALLTKIQVLSPHTLVILVSGHGDRALGVEALEAGAYWYVEKPIDREFFGALVKRAVRETRLRWTVEAQNRHADELAIKLTDLLHRRSREHERCWSTIDLIGLGLYQWTPDVHELYWSPQLFTLLGLNPDQGIPSIDLWFDVVHPDDRGTLKRALFSRQDEPRFPLRYRVLSQDSQVRTLIGWAAWDHQARTQAGVMMDLGSSGLSVFSGEIGA